MKGLCWPDTPRDDSSMVNITLPSTCIPLQLPTQYPPQWTNSGPIEMTEEWKMIWDSTLHKFQNLLQTLHENNNTSLNNQTLLNQQFMNDSNNNDNNNDNNTNKSNTIYVTMLLNYLYSRFGYDCGYILSTMHSNKISWGTYQDAMCRVDYDEWHCNAHINNLVIIPPPSLSSSSPLSSPSFSQEFFLSYLDLDMAYHEDEVINSETEQYGKDSGYPFDNIIWREYVNMMEVLAGNDSSTGVPQIALSIIESYSKVLTNIQSCLNDTMILSYIESYQQNMTKDDKTEKKFSLPFNKELHEASYCLIELAIIVMANYIA